MLRIHDTLLHSAALSLLVGSLAAFNRDLRSQIVNIATGDAATELATVAAPATRAGRLVIQTVSDYRTDNEFLFGFVIVATVLFAFLFRS